MAELNPAAAITAIDADIRGLSRESALLRILFVATSYPRDAQDWRGRFIADISASLARQQVLRVAQWAPPGVVASGVELATTPAEADWLSGLMAQGGISHRLRTAPIQGLLDSIVLLRALRSAYRRAAETDLYHLNWLQCALPLPQDGKPALITVLGNDMRLLGLPMMRHALRRVMRKRKVALCPNADWMVAPLKGIFGDLATVTSVPFGIDARWYCARRDPAHLHSPPCWLVVTRLTGDKLGPLFDWSEPLFKGKARQLHLFGPRQEAVSVPEWVHYHGPATPEQLVSDWFPRAQGLITLSRHAEGRPQVILEAMAAGLPIVASRLPAHVDIIENGHTGYICETPEHYGDALDALESPDLNMKVGGAARAWARQIFGTWDDCAVRYLRIYQQLQVGAPRV
jgi:hypothetical protein